MPRNVTHEICFCSTARCVLCARVVRMMICPVMRKIKNTKSNECRPESDNGGETESETHLTHVRLSKSRFESILNRKSAKNSRNTTKVSSNSIDAFLLDLHNSMRDGGLSDLRMIGVRSVALIQMAYDRFRSLFRFRNRYSSTADKTPSHQQ